MKFIYCIMPDYVYKEALILIAVLLTFRFLIGPYNKSEVSLYSYEQIRDIVTEFSILKNDFNLYMQDGEISRSEDRQLRKNIKNYN